MWHQCIGGNLINGRSKLSMRRKWRNSCGGKAANGVTSSGMK